MKPRQYRPLDLSDVKTYSVHDRPNKVRVEEHFAEPPQAGRSFQEFFDSLPNLLGAENLRQVVSTVVAARQQGRPVVLAMGAHVIKCGLQPVLKRLCEEGVITAVAVNGATVIHDFEVAMIGGTSEDVGNVLHSGEFGFARETAEGINAALDEGMAAGVGFGQAVGEAILRRELPYAEQSLLATCVQNEIPITVHVAVGTDIIHQNPSTKGAVVGEMSYRDFRLLADVVCDLSGGVWLNVGSAVIMPEVFLKALSIAQNLGHHVDGFTTANFDMQQHYRPSLNVVSRPTSGSGRGYQITGHHEINIPLFAHAVLERLQQDEKQ